MDDRHLCLIIVLCAMVLTGGCASARYIVKDPDGGIVGIPSNTKKNREKAVALMQQHFPAGYVIEREEETVIGQTTHHHVNHGTTIEGDKNRTTEAGQTHATETTVANTEYRIFYRRR
jgi:hypothetical protein